MCMHSLLFSTPNAVVYANNGKRKKQNDIMEQTYNNMRRRQCIGMLKTRNRITRRRMRRNG